ncbi:hypothetical protein BSL78_02019 [Apostichopus japonicus]|uniref:Uncharacterized protein n=1 Tax=Stichopus japonicus TaxID=307972 RepID=A0A2G8LL94_STIJA|nr:hypothetical protein BSL78_02019 [Apostichopus japonicus]
MEKKRRARINDSLTELKNLVLQALNRTSPRHSKLEKADILEMTVKYLRSVHGRHVAGKSAATPNPVVSSQYRSGFRECMLEVSKFLDNTDASSSVRLQLLDHLSQTCGTPHGASSTVGSAAFRPGSSYKSTTDGNLAHALPIYRLPTSLSQDSSHSAPQPAHLASDSVQSLQAMQINTPPTLPAMNIQLPALSKLPVGTLSLPVPSLPVRTPSTPFSSPSVPPISSRLSPNKAKETDQLASQSTELKAPHENSESIAQSSKYTANTTLKEGANHSGGSVVISSIPGGDVTVVLPHSALPGGKVPTHLIPIYQPSLNMPQTTNVVTSRPEESSPPASQFVSTSIPVSVPISSASPRAGTVAPVAWYTRPAYLTTNIDQGHAVVTQQGTPVTITLPIQARIVQNIIPIQAASLSPIATGTSVHHIPIRMANPNGEPLSEHDFMWRPW